MFTWTMRWKHSLLMMESPGTFICKDVSPGEPGERVGDDTNKKAIASFDSAWYNQGGFGYGPLSLCSNS